MKIDLCKMLGVEEKEEFKIEGCDYNYRFRVYNNRIQHFDKELKLWEYSTLTVNALAGSEIIKLPKKKEFSQDTLNFFKCIDKRWRYIAKDKNGTISAFGSKPTKKERCWLNYEGFDCLDVFKNSLFTEIKWEDEEPIYIDDYVER